ncbi:MAG: glutamate--tRNA ligase [Erysipelotrichales bacterium]|nr:glutamate--tRNA ligase [Erysipelotrichales bacterium]
MNNNDLAELLFPEIKETIEDLEKRFPKRDLPSGALVTRFAPSPTGFLHTGSLFTSLIAHKFAKDTKGLFYIRLEDTDTKREIEGSGADLLKQLKEFVIIPSEGYLGDHEEGNYGPYKQSERASIYKTVIKQLVRDGKAYPCFCSQKDLEDLRSEQEKNKVTPGYYGEYAKCRNISVDEAIERIKSGEPYVIRFRSSGNHNNKVKVHDLIRGDLELSENDQDIVILKSDGLPTYHFAHAVDDHFMRTNCVTRGEEWLSSLPIHIELFNTLGFELPMYAHLPVIMKLDNGNRRKLSKRKDDEAAVSFFLKDGYPFEALIEYLLTIANSNFEEWKAENRDKSNDEFKLSFEKMSLDGALFDIMKLKFISKELLSRMNKVEITNRALAWAKVYDEKLLDLINRDKNYFISIMNIEREKENPRKDYEKFSDMFNAIKFFYEDYYLELMNNELPFNPFISKDVIKNLLNEFSNTLDLSLDEQVWFNSLKELGTKYGFAESNKIYKQNKDMYIGHVGDVAELLRITLTSSKQSPNLYYVLQILGKDKIAKRIDYVINNKL